MNEPQLTAEMRAKYNDLRPYIKSGVVQEKIDEVFNWFATALEEQGIKQYKKALSDMFLEIAKLAEPDERQPSAGDLKTNMDNIWEIKKKLEQALLNGKEE